MKKQQDMTDSLIETIQISDEEHQQTLNTLEEMKKWEEKMYKEGHWTK